MSIAVVCPQCAAKLNAPDSAAGKKVKCPKCQSAIVVPQPLEAQFEVVDDEPAPPKKPAAKPKAVVKAAVEVDDEDEVPRKKPRAQEEDDEDDDQPKKKKKKKRAAASDEGGVSMARNIVMGVLLLVLIGVAAYVFYDRSKKKEDGAVANNSEDARVVNPKVVGDPANLAKLDPSGVGSGPKGGPKAGGAKGGSGGPKMPGPGPKLSGDPYQVDWWEEVPTTQRSSLEAAAKRAFTELQEAGVTCDPRIPRGYSAKLDKQFLTPDGKIEPKILRALRLMGVSFLTIDAPELSDAGIQELDQLRCLNTLIVNGGTFSDAGLSGLKELKSLTVLELWGIPKKLPVTGDGLKHFSDLKKLNKLTVRNAAITDAQLSILTSLPNLGTLNLQDNAITDTGLMTLAACPKLEYLDLTETPMLTQSAVEKAEKVNSKLQVRLRKP